MRAVTLVPGRSPVKSVCSQPATKTTRPDGLPPAGGSRGARPAGTCLLRRVLEEGRREPHLEAEPERDIGNPVSRPTSLPTTRTALAWSHPG